ncbi:hypothetical protein H9Q69_004281 [Fusarium xylarioides]|uniref:Uncharacterized protein n=1 Tax=Fusarium xylarioides TaxID=221167 RepID=A0A9P7ILP7_9HYPO|nr:hypothetical protein H9Q70_004144 [Fusarium xylarioides]KAG5758369.1 hypothetical protein H9Q72_013503 [Fusarium xylarioides]KAG5796706.1 hypothetical protein H9Q69_004281 [Fusarium xylarioides]KAG5806249.1 hypothetical protein H9Q71_009178 [Fusarium xylarioides]KAG5823857.1 hypothetical protein H9Q74_006045 [Fusarium xylarioides]
MNPSIPPSAPWHPENQNRIPGTWRVYAFLGPNVQLVVSIRPARHDDPHLRDWADFESINDMRAGTTFLITSQNAMRELYNLRRYVFPFHEVDVIELQTMGLDERTVA